MTTLPPRNPNDQNEDKSWGMADLIFATERSKNVPKVVRVQLWLYFFAICLAGWIFADFKQKEYQNQAKMMDDLGNGILESVNKLSGKKTQNTKEDDELVKEYEATVRFLQKK